GLIGLLTRSEVLFLGLPFLRRYEPALPFPLFFVFCTLIWRALTSDRRASSTLASVSAGCVIALLVFSYFYLWTSAVAWFVGITLLWTIFRRQEWRAVLRTFFIVGSLLGLALIFYFRLIAQLPATLSDAQVLLATHRPDLTRTPEIVGAVILIVILVLARRRNRVLAHRRLFFALSLTLPPFLA